MKRNCTWVIACILLCLSVPLKAQVIKVENGIAVTTLTKKHLLSNNEIKKMYPYRISLGIDYLDKKWYSLSSEIGYIRKGIKVKIPTFGTEKYDYHKIGGEFLTLNTTFRLKGSSRKETYYIGVGPRIDINVKGYDADVYDKYIIENELVYPFIMKTKSVLYGLKCEAGFNYAIDNLLLGFNFSYLPTFNKIYKKEDISIRDRTFTFGLSVGYIIN